MSLDCFYKSKRNAGGRRLICIDCYKAKEQERRDNMTEDEKEDLYCEIAAWKANHPESARKHQEKWRIKKLKEGSAT